MRPLRPIPARIGLPLAELILGIRDFAPLRWSDQGLCKVSSANLWTPRFFEKNRVKLFCHERTHIVRNMGTRSALA